MLFLAANESTNTAFTIPIGRLVTLAVVFAIRQIAPMTIYRHIRWINMMKVSTWASSGATAKPTLGEGVFTIVTTFTFVSGTRTLIIADSIMCYVGITITNCRPIGKHISLLKSAPDAVQSSGTITNLLKFISIIIPIDDVKHRRLQCLSFLSIGIHIVSACVVRSLCTYY